MVNKQLSRTKGNQAVDFGQQIEYNLRNIFLKESYANAVGILFPGPFKVFYSLSLLYPKFWNIEIY